MNCPTCTHKLQEKWSYCPICGSQVSEEIKEFLTDKATYLSLRDVNIPVIQEKFESIKNIIILPFFKEKKIRSVLGDKAHVNLFQAQIISTACVSPRLTEWTFMIAKLAGYYMVYTPTRSRGVKQALDLIKSGEESWKIPANAKIVSLLKTAWMKNGLGEIIKVDAAPDGTVTYKVKDVCCSIEAVGSKYCSLVAVLCGQAEALTDSLWCGELAGCQHLGRECCTVKIKPGDEKFINQNLEETELSDILDSIVESIVAEKPRYPRQSLGDDFHFSMHQVLNCLLVTPSPGHYVLAKHAGVLTGKRLAEKAGINGRDEALNYLKDVFTHLKAGILSPPETREEKTIIKMNESAYSSGVSDMHSKLDAFPAGIIEGALNQATDDKWRVEETKCQANGDETCEFQAKKIN
ncbi:MAG: V4R domain-containing protein [Candidatus Altiarchaeota archaeon]